MSFNQELDGIAVIGMAGRFPGAAGVGELWHNLLHGVEGLKTFTSEELRAAGVPAELSARPEYVPAAGVLDGIDQFDADFFGFSPREAEILDPQHRLFLECAWHALEDAAIDSQRFSGRIGVFAGAGLNAYLLLHVHPNRELLEAVGAYAAVLATDEDFLTTRASYKLDLTGPSISVQTACSSSLVAVALACSSLAAGECDAALAGGVTVRLPHAAGYLYQQQGILSPDGRCRPFDAAARGTVPASGVALVTLKRLADAVADGDPVRAVIRGWAVNNDGGDKAGYTTPRAEGQEAAILEALALAGFDPDSLGYVEGHGTATPIGDPIEVAALTRAFRAHTERSGFCSLGSVKGHLGHLDGAAGVAGLIKTVLAVERGVVPGTLNFEQPNPSLELATSPFVVHAETQSWESSEAPRRAGVSSFGIGGTNAHVVLEQTPPPAPTEDAEDGAELLVLSARAAEALATQRQALAVHLRGLGEDGSQDGLADVLHTLRTGRRQLPYRYAMVSSPGRSPENTAVEVAAALDDTRRGVHGELDPTAGPPALAFLFPGQGVQYPGMSAGLYHRYPVFAEALDRCAEHLEPALGVDLRRILFPAAGAETQAASELRRTAITQPALFATGYAASELWRACGVEPEVMLGHSVGEYLAATLAGVFEWRDALSLVAERGRLVDSLPVGAMLAIALPEAELETRLARHPELALAAVNAPAACTAGGPPAAVDAFAAELDAENVPYRRLHVERAFHSPALEPLLAGFAERVAAFPRRPPRRAFLSSVTGGWISAHEATDPEYWARQLRQPVRFADAAAALLERPQGGDSSSGGGRYLLDIGPGEALATLLRQHPSLVDPERLITAGRHPQDPRDDVQLALEAAARLWVAGVPVRLEQLGGGASSGVARRRVQLPLYPFQRRRYWVEATTPPNAPTTGKRADRTSWFYAPLWRQLPSPQLPSPLPPNSQPTAAEREEAAEVRRSWLLLAPEHEPLDEALVGTLTESLAARRETPPASRQAADELLESLRADDALPTHILYFGSRSTRSSAEEPGAALEPLLDLVHALAHGVHAETLRLTVLTRGALGVLGDEADDGGGEAAAFEGLVRSIPQEHPNLRCRLLDLPARLDGGDPQLGALLDALLGELSDDDAPAVIARRGAHRWRLAFDPYPLAAPLEGQLAARSALPAGGHFLITGGLGRFGLLAAELLAEHYGARLTLLDLAVDGGRARDPAAAARVAALPEALLLGADLTTNERASERKNESELERALNAARERFGPFDGVIHAAGFDGGDGTPYATVAETDGAFYRAHRGPKLFGLVAIDRLLGERGEGQRLALVPSSLAPILGGIGLAAYAAVDAAVDAFAERRAGRLPWCSVNFEGWESPLEGSGGSLGAAQSALTLAEEELSDVLLRILPAIAGGELRRLAVATGELEGRIARWGRAGRSTDEPSSSAFRSEHQAPYRAPVSATEQVVATIWQDVLGVETVGLDDDFFMLGGSSLVGLQVISRLRAELDIELPLRSFFEARTAEALAAEIDAERAQGDIEAARMAELLAEIEDMSSEDVAMLLEQEGVVSSRTLEERLRSLPPEKRRLLELRLDKEKRAAAKSQASAEAFPLPPELAHPDPAAPPEPMAMSLFFFSADGSAQPGAGAGAGAGERAGTGAGAGPGAGGERYRLLLDSARFADREGFTAVWTPERHFKDFGGLYPNPSLLGCALAAITERVEIRAGSVVLPLHDPIRLAEEWAVVDNLSNGRAAIACAAGWHPDDFVLFPDHYEQRKQVLVEHLEQLRTLWRGDAVMRTNGAGNEIEVRTLPRPLRAELPVWLTSSGNTQTWEQAGTLGANVLSSLGSQPFADLATKIERYRAARGAAGHDPATGVVSLMLHTYLAETPDAAREATREPLADYMKSHLEQRDSFLAIDGIGEADVEALIPLAFEHYTRTASLIGCAASTKPLIDHLARLGVDELACLIDFGLDAEQVLAGLERLALVRRRHELRR